MEKRKEKVRRKFLCEKWEKSAAQTTKFDFELSRRSSVIGPGRKKKPSTVNETQVTLRLREQPEIERSSDFFKNPEVFGGKMDNKTDIHFLGYVEPRLVSYLVF